jgi:hypothetical protein
MNDLLGDRMTDGNLDVSLCHRMNVKDDRNDLNLGVTMDASHDLRTNDRLDDHLKGDDRRGALDGHRKNEMDDQNDLKTDVNLDVSLCRRMNGTDDRNDLKMDVNHVNRRSGVHLNAQLVYEHRVDLSIDPECYALRDLMMGANVDDDLHGLNLDETMVVKNLHVRLMVYLSMNCDRMSHDHLRCGHLKMRHHDTNRMDGMNLDGMKNSGAMNSGARMI